jgi:hypothetical protein
LYVTKKEAFLPDILFLDVDGVLNGHLHDKSELAAFELWTKGLNTIYPDCLDNLKMLLTGSKIKVVVSSTWRKRFNTAQQFADSVGIDVSYLHEHWRTGNDPRGHRGNEIDEWLRGHPKCRYVVLDDESTDISAWHPLVKTSPYSGLQMYDVDRIIYMFERWRY